MKAFILLLRVGAILFVASLEGCAHVPAASHGDVAPLFHDALFKPPAQPVDDRAVLAVDASMQRFLAAQIVPKTHHADPRQALLDALNGELRLDYDSETTRTASQTFATGSRS